MKKIGPTTGISDRTGIVAVGMRAIAPALLEVLAEDPGEARCRGT